MKNLLTRTLTGAIFVAAIIGCTLWNHYSFSMLFLIVTVLALHEFYSNLSKKGIAVQSLLGSIIGALTFVLFACISIFRLPFLWLSLLLPLLFSIFIVELYRKKENPFQNIAFTVLGVIYIAVSFGLLNFLTNSEIFIHARSKDASEVMLSSFLSFFTEPQPAKVLNYVYEIVLGLFILTWTNDTFAYLTGMTFGKHRLFERHSPKKSWEGFIGGVVFCIAAACLLHYMLALAYLNICDWIVLALIISCIGTLGDLVESMYKRSLEIKDSGAILPGHGGILDRFDSILISTPFVFTYLIIVKNLF